MAPGGFAAEPFAWRFGRLKTLFYFWYTKGLISNPPTPAARRLFLLAQFLVPGLHILGSHPVGNCDRTDGGWLAPNEDGRALNGCLPALARTQRRQSGSTLLDY
jgi:hypothetical protein